MSEKSEQKAPEQSTCGTCGYAWVKGQHGGHSCATLMAVTIAEQARELAALKAQPSGVVLSDEELWSIRNQVAIHEVLRDDDSVKICVKHGRAIEQAVLGRLNSSPVSAGEPAKCSYQDDPRSPTELSLAGCNCVRFGEGNPHWPCKLHPAASAGGMDERAAFEAAYEEKARALGIDFDRIAFVRGADGLYVISSVQTGWWAWKARAALTASAPTYRTYTTTPGEAVAGIALRQLGDESRWVEVRDLNAHAFPDIGPHDYYPVGTVLRLPPASAPNHSEQVREGWQLVPVEPTPAMLDVAVSFALNVSLSGEYNWSSYMRDVWLRMLAAAPSAGSQEQE